MLLTLVLAGLWLAATLFAALAPAPLPPPFVWVLIVLGVPLLGLVTLTMGPAWGLGGLAMGALALRRPMLRAGLWQGQGQGQGARPPETEKPAGE